MLLNEEFLLQPIERLIRLQARLLSTAELIAISQDFSKFATKSAVALSRAKFREICRGRSAVVALDDRLSRGLLFSPKNRWRASRAKVTRHQQPISHKSQIQTILP